MTRSSGLAGSALNRRASGNAKGRPDPIGPQTGGRQAELTAGAAAVGRWRVDRVELGELLGVHADTVSEWSRQGMPVAEVGRHGKPSAYDLKAVISWWRDRQGRHAEITARTRAFNATAAMNELKLAREQRALLPREDVIRDGQAYTKAWANTIRAIARRARQAGIVTTPQAEADLNALCRQLLVDISSWKTRADAERASRRGVA